MDASRGWIGIGQVAEAAATGREAEREALTGIAITHRDVAEGIDKVGGDGPGGPWGCQAGGAVELGRTKAIAGIHQLSATILQLKVDTCSAIAAGGEGGVDQGSIDAAGAASELDARSVAIHVR